MGSLNFPIIPYKRKALPTDISQGEDELSRRLFAGMGGGQAQEIPFEAMPLGDFTDGATTEKNLQRIGSQPFVKNVNFEPIVSPAPVVNNSGMFAPKVAESLPAIPRGMFGQSAEYDGQPPIASGLLPAPTPELSFNPMRVDTPNPRNLEILKSAGAPSEVIEPSDAPLPEIPLQRINVNQDAIDAGLSSADPRQFRAAQAMRTNYDESKPRSIGGKILHRLGGIGRGLLEGLSVGGAGGGIMGSILGGINPRLATNLSNRRELAERLPENAQAEELKRRQQQQELQRQQQQSIESDRQERLALAQQRQREIEAERVRTNAEQAAAVKEKKETEGYKRNQDLINNRQQITKEDGTRLTMADLFTPKIDPETEKVIGNTGEIIQIGDKDVYRLPSAEQKQQRKLEEARAKGEADLQLGLAEDAIKRGRDLQDLPIKEGIKNEFNPPADKNAPTRKDVADYQSKLRQAEALIEQADKNEQEASTTLENIKPTDDSQAVEDVRKRAAKLRDEAKDKREKAQVLRSEGRTLKRSVRDYQGGTTTKPTRRQSASKNAVSADLDDFAGEFGGDKNKALQWLKANGYTLDGKPIQ